MRFIPYDIGTFLVPSRSRRGERHIIDLIDWTCSCEGYQSYMTCAHLREAWRRRTFEHLRIIVGMRRKIRK
jgi:hypothetical protein